MAQGGKDLTNVQLQNGHARESQSQVRGGVSGAAKELFPPRTAQPVIKGYLQKKGKRLKKWHQRYFEIQGKDMHYYKNPTKKERLGSIDLSLCTSCGALRESGPGAAFEVVTTIRTHILCAMSSKQRDQWIQAIQSQIKPTNTTGRTIQRNLSLQHHRNPEPRRISRQNSLLDRFRLRKRQESAPVIIANESSVPSVRNRPLSLAVYNIPEEEPGAGPGALVVTPRSLPPTPMVQRKPEDLSQYPTEPICYDSSDEEDTEVIQPSPPLGYVPPDLSAFDEPISLPTNKEVAGKFEGVNPPDFSVLDEPIHNEAPHTLRSKDDMNPPDFSVLDEPICHDEMSPETKKAGTSEDPPDFSVLDKPICLAANNIEEVPKAEIPTIVVVEKSEDGPPDFSILDDPIPLSGAEDVPRTLPDTTLPSLALAAPLLEENSNSNPPDFSVLNEPISSHVGDIDEASEVVLPGKENHSQLENYVPPDFSAFDEPICLPTDEEMPETSQDPQIEKKADFSAFDEPILFPSNLPPPSAEKKANYTPDFSAFDQHHSSDDQEESVLPLHSLPSLPLLVEGTSEEINIPPGFSVFNDLALKDIDPGSTGILSGGPDENFGSIFDQIEDVLSQDDNQMPLSTVGADTKIAVAKERETIMADSQLPAPIEGRTFTWDKLRSMLDESDSMPPESSTVVCVENQEWMKHTSGIEQLRSFLEVSD